MSKQDIEKGERLTSLGLSPEERRQLLGSKVNPLFTKRPYWCTNYGVLDDEMSSLRSLHEGDKEGDERIQHDNSDEEMQEVRLRIPNDRDSE